MDRKLLDACTHCGFCLPTCPTYGPLWQQEADSPRGRIYLMERLADGSLPLTSGVVEHFDRCLGCMACVTACPSGVRYDRLIEETRAYVEERHERTPEDWLVRVLAFAVLPHPRRMRATLPLAQVGRLLPLPAALRPFAELAPAWRSSDAPAEVTPAEGRRRLRVGLLAGCVQRVLFGDVNAATARVLAADGCEVMVPRGQGCCGALHLHAGRRAEGHTRARRIEDVFRKAGVDAIAVNAAGCGSHLKDAELDLPVRDVSELLAELGPRARRRELALRVAFQDSCHLAHAQGLREEPRASWRRCRGSTWRSRPSRRSAAAAPGSTTSSSPLRPATSASERPRTCSRRSRTSTRPPTPAASSRSRRLSAVATGHCPRSIPSSSSTPPSAAFPPRSSWPARAASRGAACLGHGLEHVAEAHAGASLL